MATSSGSGSGLCECACHAVAAAAEVSLGDRLEAFNGQHSYLRVPGQSGRTSPSIASNTSEPESCIDDARYQDDDDVGMVDISGESAMSGTSSYNPERPDPQIQIAMDRILSTRNHMERTMTVKRHLTLEGLLINGFFNSSSR
ncbi:hypothetical protein ANCCEY_05266 [Ancylostoma ceylanicum]|uniref:Uncharacterized protein n=1 Tax=Ancylostoma ceylanicum TaxID=53326 RepID=A0A0D6LU88_9BILA|nr:hypothetical protein ANCCEY_05266 [Ancylostoma ceylanicum]